MSKLFKCKFCQLSFSGRSGLKLHLIRHTGQFPFKCEFCSKGYPTKQEYRIHRNLHLGIKPFECTLCPKKFSQRPHLTSHLRIHTGDKPFKCHLCPKQFTQSSHLKTHHLHHTGEKPFKCQVCGDCFRLSSTLKCHMRRHTGEKPYKCVKCGMRFSQTSPLYHHMAKEHPPSKDKPHPFTCQTCGKGFYMRQLWKDHKRQACGVIKMFTCLFCEKRGGGQTIGKYNIYKFSYQKDLEDHLRKHTEERPYFCRFCDLCFIDSKAKRYHMRIHLNERKTVKMKKIVKVRKFFCEYCHHWFSEKERLDRHVRQNHSTKLGDCIEQVDLISNKKQEATELVKKQMQRRINYERFVKLGRMRWAQGKNRLFKCDKCVYAFQTDIGRTLHIKIVHEGVVVRKCSFCWKMFPTDDKLECHIALEHGKS